MNKREYAQANKDWLIKKAKEEGVQTLPKGILYKVLTSGENNGKHPSPRSIVTVHYTGRTIDGKEFDSSRGGVPPAMRLSDLIEGWLSHSSRCAWVTSGKSISHRNWATASSRSRASQATPHSSSR